MKDFEKTKEKIDIITLATFKRKNNGLSPYFLGYGEITEFCYELEGYKSKMKIKDYALLLIKEFSLIKKGNKDFAYKFDYVSCKITVYYK